MKESNNDKIVFPESLSEDERLKILRILQNRDQEIEKLNKMISNKENQGYKDLYTKYFNLHRKVLEDLYPNHHLMDVNYPKNFGTGYTLEEMTPGTFIRDGYFIQPKIIND